MKRFPAITLIVLVGITINACGPNQSINPSLIATPTSTLIPTNNPTLTLTPTNTPTLTPTPVLPALAQTPIPIELQSISPDNAPQLREIGIIGFGSPTAIAWSPNSQYLAVATAIGVVLYSPPKLTQTYFWYLDQRTKTVAFDQTGQILAVGTDSEIRLWDTVTFKELSFSPIAVDKLSDIKFGLSNLYAFSQDGLLSAFNSKTGSLLKSLDLKIGDSMAISPDGQYLALSGNSFINIIDLDSYEITQIKDYAMYYTSLSFSPNGKLLAALSPAENSAIHFWDFSTKKLVNKISNGMQFADDSSINGIAFRPDGNFVAMVCANTNYHNSLCIASVYGFDITKQYEIAKSNLNPYYNLAGSAFSPDGSLLAIVSDGAVTLWDSKNLTEIGTISGLSGDISSLALSGQDQSLVANRSDTSVALWDISGQSLTNTISGFSYYRGFAADENGLLYIGSGNSIQIWRVSDGIMLHDIPAHDNLVTGIAVSRDGTILASASLDGRIKVFDPTSGKLIRNFTMASKDAFAVALSPDGTQVVGGGGNDNPSPILWDIQTGKVIQKINGIFAYKITYSSDGQYIAGVGFNGVVNIWDAHSGSLVKAFTDLQMDNGNGGIAFSPDGKIVAASGAGYNYTGMVALWDMATGNLLTKFRSSNRYQTEALLFSSDGTRLFAVGRDGVIRAYGVTP